MNNNAKKWVEALRSCEYSQTREWLQDRNGYCCLGVACAVYEKEKGISLPKDVKGFYSGVYLDDCGYGAVQDWIGLSSGKGRYNNNDKISSLAGLNDSGKTFAEIADIIESEPEGLFVEGSK